MANETEKTTVTGLEYATDRKEAEYDLVTSLLEAAGFKEDDDCIEEVEIKRAGKYLFSVHIHPISDEDTSFARKKATTYMPHPENKKLPPIEKEFNSTKFTAWLIYIATTEEDQEKIWGNPAIMSKLGVTKPVETIDRLLKYGEKQALANRVYTISGMDEDEGGQTTDEEEYAKN
ncbi:MAG: hypothetical protein IKC59_01085 [Clostridia bacterium]|nr:hypothetical protein [Clostridia bacterium]